MEASRAARVAEEMDRAGYQALICRLPEHLLMLVGYMPVLGNSFCVISSPSPGEIECRLLVPADELDLVPDGVAVTVRAFTEMTLEHLGTALDVVPEPLGALLREAGVAAGRGAVGYEGSPSLVAPAYTLVGIPGAATIDLYRQALPDVELRDASPLLEDVAAIKTPADVAGIRKAVAAANDGILAVRSAHAGVPGAYVAAAATEAALQSACAYSSTGQALVQVHVMTGPHSALAYRPYNLTTIETIRPGEPILVQIEVCVDGYWADVTRTFFGGDMPGEWYRVHQACQEAHTAALAAIRPGAQARAVDAAARSVLREAGFGAGFKHGLGHGVGFQAINQTAAPILHPVADSVLHAGMVHTLEPAVYLTGKGGFRLNDDVLVTESGPELLSAMIPRTLEWMIVPEK